jgi:hypothetical protein
MREGELQLRFDEGHQQRYFPDRRSLLECILRVASQSPHPRFEIWGEGKPMRLTDGRSAGRRFELKEVLDLRDERVRERVVGELSAFEHDVEPS